jgi:hypothetical protein
MCLSAVCRSAATASPSGAGRAPRTTPRQARAGGGGAGWAGTLALGLTRGWYTGCARTGGSFVVDVVDGSTSVESR